VYVKVTDPSHAGETRTSGAPWVDRSLVDLVPVDGAPSNTFITGDLDFGAASGREITATYTDPDYPADTSSTTMTIGVTPLVVETFYAGPRPFDDDTAFTYHGKGVAPILAVEVYDLHHQLVWSEQLANVKEIVWSGAASDGSPLASGAYIYMITASDGAKTFSGEVGGRRQQRREQGAVVTRRPGSPVRIRLVHPGAQRPSLHLALRVLGLHVDPDCQGSRAGTDVSHLRQLRPTEQPVSAWDGRQRPQIACGQGVPRRVR
jgi:hypothetical protein